VHLTLSDPDNGTGPGRTVALEILPVQVYAAKCDGETFA